MQISEQLKNAINLIASAEEQVLKLTEQNNTLQSELFTVTNQFNTVVERNSDLLTRNEDLQKQVNELKRNLYEGVYSSLDNERETQNCSERTIQQEPADDSLTSAISPIQTADRVNDSSNGTEKHEPRVVDCEKSSQLNRDEDSENQRKPYSYVADQSTVLAKVNEYRNLMLTKCEGFLYDVDTILRENATVNGKKRTKKNFPIFVEIQFKDKIDIEHQYSSILMTNLPNSVKSVKLFQKKICLVVPQQPGSIQNSLSYFYKIHEHENRFFDLNIRTLKQLNSNNELDRKIEDVNLYAVHEGISNKFASSKFFQNLSKQANVEVLNLYKPNSLRGLVNSTSCVLSKSSLYGVYEIGHTKMNATRLFNNLMVSLSQFRSQIGHSNWQSILAIKIMVDYYSQVDITEVLGAIEMKKECDVRRKRKLDTASFITRDSKHQK